MAVPNVVRVPVPCEFVFPAGALALGVEPVKDFDAKGKDDQARDEHGERLWAVRVMDLDPEAGRFGRSTEVKVKVAAPVQPVLPPSAVPGYPPAVEFADVVISPWTDTQKCRGNSKGPHRCGARLGWSVRAGAVVEPQPARKSSKAA